MDCPHCKKPVTHRTPTINHGCSLSQGLTYALIPFTANWGNAKIIYGEGCSETEMACTRENCVFMWDRALTPEEIEDIQNGKLDELVIY